MRVTAVETLNAKRFPHLCYVQVHTDAGLSGLGETFFEPRSVVAHVHGSIAPRLLGQDVADVATARARLDTPTGSRLGPAWRALSAVDEALWDLAGQAAGRPTYELLGPPARDRIKAYNTCAGYDHPGWEIGGPTIGPHDDDHAATFARPEALAESLLRDGFGAMKVWPFEVEPGGAAISRDALERGLEPIRRIRRAHGDAMDIMVDGGRWSVSVAQTIGRALVEYRPFWLEDFVPDDEPSAWRALASATGVTLAGGEDLGGQGAFRDLLDDGLAVPIFDPGWVGGVTEARAVIALAQAYGRPFCPHDCTGPISFVIGAHLCMAAPNALLQEVVRAYVLGAYREIVTDLPRLEGGFVHAPEGAGLGTRLTAGFRAQARSELSRL